MHRYYYCLLACILSLVSFILPSCNDKFDFENTYLLDEESKDWLFPMSKGDTFCMADTLGNTETFTLNRVETYFDRTSASKGYLGISRGKDHWCEVQQQGFSSDGNLELGLNLQAGYFPGDPELELTLNQLVVTINPLTQQLIRVRLSQKIDEFSSHGNLLDGNLAASKLTNSDSLIINNTIYTDVMSFQLNDFLDLWEPNTTVSFLYAKEQGLIQYRKRDGQVFVKEVSSTD